MFHVKHLHDGAVLASIAALREEITELETVRLIRPWAIPAIIAAAHSPVSGMPVHRNARESARATAEATLRLEPLNQGNRALAALLAVLVMNLAGEEVTLEEVLEQGIIRHRYR